MTTTYYRHSSSSSTTSSLPPVTPNSSKNRSHIYSATSGSSTANKYSSTGYSSTISRNNRYTGSTTSSSPLSYTSNYKARSSYDLNSSSSSSSTTSSNRPLSYSTYTPSINNSYTPKSYNYSSASSSCNGSSSYLNRYSSGTSSTNMGYSTTPVTLTRFNHRRSSLDYNNDSDSGSSPTTARKSNNNKIPAAGLVNLGNTCYMNSVLQALYATKQLRDYIISGIESGQLYTALSKLFKQMSSSPPFGRVNPTMFRDTFIQIEKKFRSFEQQDAQEFLSYLINDLHEELNKAKSRSRGTIMIEPKTSQEAWNLYRNRFNDSKLVDLFVGQYSSVIKCSHCGNESTCWDPFWDISLPVPRYRSLVDIEECLAAFTEAETLDGNEKPTCSKCKQPRKSTKRLSIVRSPKILVIHLKKFSNDGYKLSSDINVNQRIKIDNSNNNNNNYSNSINNNNNNNNCTAITDNQHLYNNGNIHHNTTTTTNNNNNNNIIDITTTNGNIASAASTANVTIYELYACVCHHGFSSKSGHYTAYCQYLDSKWFHFNDDMVKEVTDTFTMDTLKDAYVLFYRIQDSPSSTSSSSSYSKTTSSSRYSSRL